MAKNNGKGEPVGWVTIKGKHFPKWADGTIGWQDGQEDIPESKNSKTSSKSKTINAYTGDLGTKDLVDYPVGTKLDIEGEKWTKTGKDEWTYGKGDDQLVWESKYVYKQRMDGDDFEVTITKPSNDEKKVNKPISKKSDIKQPAVNDKGTMTPKDLQKAERRRDELWDKEDHNKLTAAEKKELAGLEKSISGHYREKKLQESKPTSRNAKYDTSRANKPKQSVGERLRAKGKAVGYDDAMDYLNNTKDSTFERYSTFGGGTSYTLQSKHEKRELPINVNAASGRKIEKYLSDNGWVKTTERNVTTYSKKKK